MMIWYQERVCYISFILFIHTNYYCFLEPGKGKLVSKRKNVTKKQKCDVIIDNTYTSSVVLSDNDNGLSSTSLATPVMPPYFDENESEAYSRKFIITISYIIIIFLLIHSIIRTTEK